MSTDPLIWVIPAVGMYWLALTTSSCLIGHLDRSTFCCSLLRGGVPSFIFQVTYSHSSVSSNSSLSAYLWPISSSMLFVFMTGVVINYWLFSMGFLLLIWASISAFDGFYCCWARSGLSGKFWTSSSSRVPVATMFFIVGLVIGTVLGSEATFTNFYYPYCFGAWAMRASGYWGWRGCCFTRLEGNADSCFWGYTFDEGAYPCF
jgi:hypothetical protein